jgi:hypothetical protein
MPIPLSQQLGFKDETGFRLLSAIDKGSKTNVKGQQMRGADAEHDSLFILRTQ